MNNLDIVKSTYEGKTSEENGEDLKRYVTEDTLWAEAAGLPFAGTYMGFEEIEKNVFARLASEWNGSQKWVTYHSGKQNKISVIT